MFYEQEMENLCAQCHYLHHNSSFPRFLSVLIGAVKYYTVAFIHTYGNKIARFLLFCFPILLKVAGLTITVMVIGTVAIISATEELMNMISSDSLDETEIENGDEMDE